MQNYVFIFEQFAQSHGLFFNGMKLVSFLCFSIEFFSNRYTEIQMNKIKKRGLEKWLFTEQRIIRIWAEKPQTLFPLRLLWNQIVYLDSATGSSPVGTYKQLIEWYNKGDLDFSKVTSINLDEYKGLGPDNDQSYRYFMNYNLFNHVNIDKARTFVPDGLEKDSQKACNAYNEIIRQQGGIDLQLLGLGHNGHIGFNEPGACIWKGDPLCWSDREHHRGK